MADAQLLGAGMSRASLSRPASHEALSYTVPTASLTQDIPVARPSGRLTNYMFAHSQYSYGLGQRGVLADLLINYDEPAGSAREPVTQLPVRVAP